MIVLKGLFDSMSRFNTLRRFAPAVGATSFGILALSAFFAGADPKVLPKLSYNKDVRPILAENCFTCHGPDSAARKAGLRLDKPGDATTDRGGYAAIVKGFPAKSEIIKRVNGEGAIMPPQPGHKRLTAHQINVLKRWISEGAEYERHWAYITPSKPAIPVVKNKTWARNPIDNFILAKLEATGLQPAPEADKRTLIRRLSLDLTGLPPTPADVAKYLSDASPNAYEKMIDKYLATPQWGEHRGRYWLDAARYADTHGIHFDNYREMWSYRDWVINAFNKNMSFDQFTIEQLGGDLIPNHTLDQVVATGFNRCNITSNEGGAIDEEYKVLYARDRTETTSQVWMGSTLGCAVCHDHKFDPFSQKEFYGVSAFFNNTTQNAMDGNIKNTPPVIFLPTESDRPRFDALKTDVAEARKQTDERRKTARAEFEEKLNRSGVAGVSLISPKAPTENLVFQAPLAEGQGRTINAVFNGSPLQSVATAEPGWDSGQTAEKAFKRMGGSSVEFANVGDFEKDRGFSASAWVKLSDANQGGAIMSRMDDQHDYRGWDVWLQGGRLASHIINKWPENALKLTSRDPLSPNVWHHVCVVYGGKLSKESLHLYVDGEMKATDVEADALKDTIKTNVPFKIGQRSTTAGIDGTSIQDVRLYDRELSSNEVGQLGRGSRAAFLASRGSANLKPLEKDELFAGWLQANDETYKQLTAKLFTLESEQSAIRTRSTEAHVMQERDSEAMAYILARGEYDKRKDPVKPLTPEILPPMSADLPRNRLGFAKWLMQPENPLTSRVTVNRFWQELFGAGIVKSTGDFGVTGDLPTHPELLDWLSIEFREKGWDIKKFFKLMVSSATYRQSAVTTPEKTLKDPKNKWLSRGPRFRMDAEMVRDYALATSGLLVGKIGGPSVKPYQPDGVWEAVAMLGSNTRDYRRDTGDSLYRRSVYTFWKRAAPPASLDIFNAPNRETCAVRRERTNTPLQALVTLNDVQYIEAARVLAQKALVEGGPDTDAKIDYIAKRLLARSFRPEEMTVVRKSLSDLGKYYNSHDTEAGELMTTGEQVPVPPLQPTKMAAWTMLVNQLMNLDEALNK